MMLKKRFLLALTLTLFILLRPVTQTVTVNAQQTVNTGSVRIVNALPGIGAIDVYLDNERVAFSLSPATATTYFETVAGRHALAVRAVGADPLSAPIADVLIDLSANASQTAVVYQKNFSGDDVVAAAQSAAFFIINDDRNPIQLGKTRLTAVHLAVGTPQRLSIGYPSGEALLYQLNLEQPYGTIDIDAGSYSLAVLNADAVPNTVIERLGEQNLNANTLYTVIVVPNVTPSAEQGVVGALSAQTRTFILSTALEPPPDDGLLLRVIHAAHSTAVLDLYVDERLIISRMNYGDFSEYLGMANYSHTVTVRRFGDAPTAPPIGRANLVINQNNRDQRTWTLLISNSIQSTIPPTPLPGDGASISSAPSLVNTGNGVVALELLPDDVSRTQQGFARVRLLNAINGLPPLILFTPAYPQPVITTTAVPNARPTPTPTPFPAPGINLVPAAIFGEVASENEVPVGLYNQLTFIPTGSTNPVLALNNVQFVSGVVYTFVVTGSPTGNPPIQVIRLEDYGTGLSLRRTFAGQIVVNARVRQGPDTTSGIVGSIPADSRVEVLGRSANNQWLRVRYINPLNNSLIEGWISATSGLISIQRLGADVAVSSLPEYTGP